MATHQKGVSAAIKDLSKSLTRNDIERIQLSLNVPTNIREKVKESNNYGKVFLFELKSWGEFDPKKFMQTIEEMGNTELITPAKKIPWLNVSVSKQIVPQIKTPKTFLNLLRDVAQDDWEIVMCGQGLEEKDFDGSLIDCIEKGIIKRDLGTLCELMDEINRNDIIPKIQNYASIFEGMSDEEFKIKIKSELNSTEEENHTECTRKLREYILSQNKEVSVILDKELVTLESVYTPVTVIKQPPEKVKSQEETTLKEIEFLRTMNDKKNKVEIVNFESHLTNCRADKPEIWTLIGNPGSGKTFLCKYAGYNYGIGNMEKFSYLLSIPCRDPEWHSIEEARQDDKNIDTFMLRWLGISLPLGAGWAESLKKNLMRSGGEGLLLIIDGADEFTKTVPFSSTLLYLLLQRRILPSATVLLTSRPGAWSEISSQFRNELKIDTEYQVLGFSPENRDAYFQKRMKSETKLEETIRLFKRHDELNLLALVPVNASLFSSLFNETEDILAQTLTDIYEALITYMVRRQLSRIGLKEYTRVSNLKGFAPEVQTCLNVIGEEAYSGIYDRDLICRNDVSLEIGEKQYLSDRLGLMHEHIVENKVGDRIRMWTYAHLTLQEFVSAVWLSNQTWTNQCVVTRYLASSTELFSMFKMVIRFVCGLLCDRAQALFTILYRNLTPDTIRLHKLPMLFQLGFDTEHILGLTDCIEFTSVLIFYTSVLFETNTNSLLKYFNQILPETLQLVFKSVVTPNEWHTFLLSLPYLSHINMIFLKVPIIQIDQFQSLLSSIYQCNLSNLYITFRRLDTATILSYTSMISSETLPAGVKLSIELDRCNIGYEDVIFPASANRFTGSVGLCYTRISPQCFRNLMDQFLILETVEYDYSSLLDCSTEELITSYSPTNGLCIRESSHAISPNLISQMSSPKEIFWETRDAYSILPYLQSLSTLTYLGIVNSVSPSYSKSYHKSYQDILTEIITKNSGTLTGIRLSHLHSIGFRSWHRIITPILKCTSLVELRILNSFLSPEDMNSWNTIIDSLPSLLLLELNCIPLRAEHMYILCDSLAYHAAIKRIEINNCKLDSTACIHLSYLIPTLPRLERIGVSQGNKLSSPDKEQLEILTETAKEYSIDVLI